MLNQNQETTNSNKRVLLLLGAAAILIGLILLLSRFLEVGWLPLAAIPVAGMLLLLEGAYGQKIGWVITGALIAGIGAGAFLSFSKLIELTTPHKIGTLLITFAAGWCLISAATALMKSITAWWALVPAGILASLGFCFLLSDLSLLSFTLYLSTGLGLVLLLWGLFWKLHGLIIAGSLLITTGPGIYFAWSGNLAVNPLAKTGLMIATFSFGWGLIVFFSRMILQKFIWWPLIPGGILAVVGWGLYIGGDPGGAPSFIANTGSIGLIIFGLYLLLLRKSIHH